MRKVNTPEEAVSILETLAKNAGQDFSMYKKDFEEKLAERGLQGAYGYVVVKIQNVKVAFAKSVGYQGLLLGTTGVVDDIEDMKRISRAVFDKDPQRAIDDGFTDALGHPLDRREKIRGKKNPNYLAPLSEEAKSNLSLMYVARAKEAESGIWSTYILEGYGSVRPLVAPIGREHPMEFRAIPSERQRYGLPVLRIYSESFGAKELPTFKEIGKEHPQGAFDTEEALNGIATTPLSKLDDFVGEKVATGRTSLLFTKGIAMNPVEDAYFDITDDDIDTSIRVFFREPQFSLPLPAEGDEVVVMGKLSKAKRTGSNYNINGWGWY
jgi:hypothetical protein